MVMKDIELASYMAMDNLFKGIIFPTILLGIFAIPTFVLIVPILQTPTVGIPVLIAVAAFFSSLYASLYAQIPLEGRVERPFLNAFVVSFSNPLNALLYPLYGALAAIILFPISALFYAGNYYLGATIQNATDFMTIILPFLGWVISNVMFYGGINAAAIALWAYVQLPAAENKRVGFSFGDLFAIALGAGIRGGIAALFIFPILALLFTQIFFLMNAMAFGEAPNLLLVMATFFTSLIAIVAAVIPMLSGIAFVRRAFLHDIYNDGEAKEETRRPTADEIDYIWRDED